MTAKRKEPAAPNRDRFMEGASDGAIKKALKAGRGVGGSGRAAPTLPTWPVFEAVFSNRLVDACCVKGRPRGGGLVL